MQEQLDRIEKMLEILLLKGIVPIGASNSEIISKQDELKRKVRLACGQKVD